ncbi:MAG TPA: hypothetical protein VK781_13435 [Solirubrobacteraceae bacterium]|nr:hypothetical protein [Solirubrobacteraceae bacterium]
MGLFSAAMLIAAAPAASQANFTPPYNTQCSGTLVFDFGTELQEPAASILINHFEGEEASPLACVGHPTEVAYTIGSSAEALGTLGSVGGVRNSAIKLASAEEPPTLSQWLSIDLGDKPLSNSGLIRQIPVAVAAVTPIVHFPTGCAIPAKEATGDGRFTVSNAQLEKVFAGEIATWGQLLPDIEASCAGIPIKRVVPAASEGATYVQKQWLNTINSSRGWLESSGLENTSWPNDSGATATVRATEGDFGEARLVSRTAGSIGFSSLAWARFFGFGNFSSETAEAPAKEFWLSVSNGSGQSVEPTRDPHSNIDGVLGANCDKPQFNITPSGYDTTATPIWRAVSAAGSKSGWPICTLLYNLAWDDAAPVYGNTSQAQGEQRTVKDYLAYTLGEQGQQKVREEDFSPLPAAFLADAKDGQSRVGWSKIPGAKEEQAKISTEIHQDQEHH